MPDAVAESRDRQTPPTALGQYPGRLAGFLRRLIAWSAANRLTAGLLAAAGLVSIGGMLVLWLLLAAANSVDQQTLLLESLAALDRGQYAEAKQLAETIHRRPTAKSPTATGEYRQCWRPTFNSPGRIDT